MLSAKKFLFWAPIFLLAACASTPPQTDTPSTQAHTLLSRTLSADAGAGIAAAVIKDGRLVWSGAVGYADMENAQAMTPTTAMRIGSVSKPITAVMTLAFAERYGVDLDTDIRQLSDITIADWNGAALSHLAAHTSGVRHFDFSNFEEANNLYYKATLADAVAPVLSEMPLFDPGARFEYSSHGYNIIGAVLERISGQSFGALLESLVASPLALDETGIDHPFNIIAGRNRQYTVTAENPVFAWMEDGALINTFYRDSSDYYPSGGLLSSAEDLAHFTAAVFEGDVLSAASLARIENAAVLSSGEEAGFAEDHLYGFGWEIRLDGSGRIISYGHNGETNGAYALIRYYPDRRLVVASIANYNVMGREPAFFTAIDDGLREIFAD